MNLTEMLKRINFAMQSAEGPAQPFSPKIKFECSGEIYNGNVSITELRYEQKENTIYLTTNEDV